MCDWHVYNKLLLTYLLTYYWWTLSINQKLSQYDLVYWVHRSFAASSWASPPTGCLFLMYCSRPCCPGHSDCTSLDRITRNLGFSIETASIETTQGTTASCVTAFRCLNTQYQLGRTYYTLWGVCRTDCLRIAICVGASKRRRPLLEDLR